MRVGPGAGPTHGVEPGARGVVTTWGGVRVWPNVGGVWAGPRHDSGVRVGQDLRAYPGSPVFSWLL